MWCTGVVGRVKGGAPAARVTRSGDGKKERVVLWWDRACNRTRRRASTAFGFVIRHRARARSDASFSPSETEREFVSRKTAGFFGLAATRNARACAPQYQVRNDRVHVN